MDDVDEMDTTAEANISDPSSGGAQVHADPDMTYGRCITQIYRASSPFAGQNPRHSPSVLKQQFGFTQGTPTQVSFQTEKVELLDEMHRRQESYMRREDKLRSRVEELEAQVSQLKKAEGTSCHDAQKECVLCMCIS